MMISMTGLALLGFLIWTLGLLLLMEVIRTKLVLSGQVVANGFTPDNASLSPFMQRLARAHANCVEGLPLFGGLLLLAMVWDQTSATNGTAWIFLAARILQSLIHLTSTSEMAVKARFTFFAVQMVLAVYWASQLLMVAI